MENFLKKAKEFWKPTEKVRPRDFIRELPKETLNTLQDIGQASMRAYAGLGGWLTGKKLTPTTEFEKGLYGTDKEISIRSTGEEVVGEGKKIAPLIGLGMAVGDLIPSGKGAKQATSGIKQGVQAIKTATKDSKAIKGISKAFEGVKGLSTKLLESFKGEPEIITRQRFNEIFNKAKKSGIRKADEDLIMKFVGDGKEVNLNKVAEGVKNELVAINPTEVKSPRWSHIGEQFIGDGKYGEVVYQSPIKTSAGDVHFSSRTYPSTFNSYDAVKASKDSFPNYFSHVRYEDMADGKTRKILETQSDLFQKNNLLRELPDQVTVKVDGKEFDVTRNRFKTTNKNADMISGKELEELKPFTDFSEDIAKQNQGVKNKYFSGNGVGIGSRDDQVFSIETARKAVIKAQEILDSKIKEFGKLKPYEADSNAHLRTFREEVKRASQNGKERLLIPDGETAMKIEGLADSRISRAWKETGINGWVNDIRLKHENIKVGQEVSNVNLGGNFYITEVLENGKFKAVSKNQVDEYIKDMMRDEGIKISIKDAIMSANDAGIDETFDISGKIDTSHFVYGLNEKDLPREARRMGLEVTGKINADGGQWWEIKIPKEISTKPTEAFGMFAGIEQDEDGQVKFDPEKAVAGMLAGLGIKKVKGIKGIDEGAKHISEFLPKADDLLKALGGKKPPVSTTAKAVGGMDDFLKERKFITRVGEMEPKLKEWLKGEYKPRSTQELAKVADEMIDSNYDQAVLYAKTGTDDKAVAVASRLIDKLVTSARETKDPASKALLYERASDVANESARNLTEHGRAIQASTLLGQLTPEGMLRMASREIQRYNEKVAKSMGGLFGLAKRIPELTGEQGSKIVEMMTKIQGIDDAIERAMEMKKLERYIGNLVPSPMSKKLSTIWKAGLLTGIKTHGLNLLSNMAHQATEIVKDIPAVMVDKIASIFTGKRTIGGLGIKGIPQGIKDGIQKGWRYWKTGFDERDIASKLDYNFVNMGNSKVAKAIQAYTESVFRSLGTADQPFYYGARSRSLMSQAIAQARNEGLKGIARSKRVAELMKAPTDKMLMNAVLDAETAVFQNQTRLGNIARAIQKQPGGEFIVPFGKTPSAVATQVWNYSPAGIVSTIVSNIGKGKFNQKAFSQGIGRGVIGTVGSMYIGRKLYDKGMISLAWPTSEKERKLWELEGRKPNTILIGGKWRSPAVLGPAGLAVIVGAHMENSMQKDGSPIGAFASLASGIGSTVTEQSFLQGLNQAIDAIKDPERSFRGFAQSFISSWIPTIIADVARSIDETERMSRTVGDRIKARIPGVRQTLEPKISTLGEQAPTGSFFTAMFDATRPGVPMADKSDPVVREIRRLADRGYQVTPTQLGPLRGYESLTPEENTFLWEISGRYAKNAIQQIISNNTYDRMDDEQRAKVINNAIQDVKVEARARALLKFTRGLSQGDINEKIAKLKDEGMVTNDVLGMYQYLKKNE